MYDLRGAPFRRRIRSIEEQIWSIHQFLASGVGLSLPSVSFQAVFIVPRVFRRGGSLLLATKPSPLKRRATPSAPPCKSPNLAAHCCRSHHGVSFLATERLRKRRHIRWRGDGAQMPERVRIRIQHQPLEFGTVI